MLHLSLFAQILLYIILLCQLFLSALHIFNKKYKYFKKYWLDTFGANIIINVSAIMSLLLDSYAHIFFAVSLLCGFSFVVEMIKIKHNIIKSALYLLCCFVFAIMCAVSIYFHYH